MHHILYTTVRKRFLGSKPNVYDLTVRRNQLKTFMGGDDVSKALDLQKEEKWSVLFPHIISGLVREDLMEDNQMWGPADLLKKVSGLDFPGTGMVICPTTLGIELYLWAYGMGDLELEVFFDPAVEFAPLPDIRYPG